MGDMNVKEALNSANLRTPECNSEIKDFSI